MHEAATPGPWELINEEFFCTIKVGDAYISAPYQPPVGRGECAKQRADGAIIPAARNALPALLKVAKAAREMREHHYYIITSAHLDDDGGEQRVMAMDAAEKALDAALAEMEKE